MPLTSTTIKLTVTDRELLRLLKEELDIETMIEVTRFCWSYTLLNLPKKKKKKSRNSS